MQQTNGSVNSKGVPPDIEHFPPQRLEMPPGVVSSFLLKTYPASKLPYLDKQSEPRENARAKALAASLFARAFSRDSFHSRK